MATRPATAPEMMPRTLGLPRTTHSVNIQARAAAAVAIWVTVMAMPARPSAASSEPALKPNQPTHSSEAPITDRTRLCGAMLSVPKPTRLPRTRAQTRPATPALMCTTVPPAKSRTPSVAEEAAAPHPVGDRAVDEDRPQAHEPQHRRELHAVGEGAGDQRRGDDGEGHLEHHEDRLGNGARDGIDAHAGEEEARQAADIGVDPAAVGEGERVADDHPDHGHQAGDGEALHDGGEHVLLAHHAAVEQRQAGDRHEQDERGGGEHPGGVAGADRSGGASCASAGPAMARSASAPRSAGFLIRCIIELLLSDPAIRDMSENTPSRADRRFVDSLEIAFIAALAPIRRSERVGVGFAGADAHDVVEAEDEDLAVADLAGLGGRRRWHRRPCRPGRRRPRPRS